LLLITQKSKSLHTAAFIFGVSKARGLVEKFTWLQEGKQAAKNTLMKIGRQGKNPGQFDDLKMIEYAPDTAQITKIIA
jgi:hypothetical protein